MSIPGIKIALTIAGFDPTGWAGLLADTAVFQSLGIEGAAVPTALTVQDLESVSECLPLGPEFLSRTLESLLRGSTVNAVKIGMLGSGTVAATVAEALQKNTPPAIVIDPVMASTGGTPLIDKEGIEVIKKDLIPLCTLVTPNIREAAILTGRAITNLAEMHDAAVDIYNDLKAGAVLVKGGHLKGTPIDLLYDGTDFTEFKGKRLSGPRGLFHGTGCLLSSAITAWLAKGESLQEAVRQGKIHTKKILVKRKERFFNGDDGG